jgi:hypothetical protein
VSEKSRQEGAIGRQASEIEDLTGARKKYEDELKRGIEANEAQKRELGQLKDENKGRKPKQDLLVEEVGESKKEIQQMAAQQNSLVKELAEAKNLLNKSLSPNVVSRPPAPGPVKTLPPSTPPKPGKQFLPSVKKAGSRDVPDGIIAHLTCECGGNVHDRGVVDVTSLRLDKK